MSTQSYGKATTIKETFSRETKVNININGTPATVWQILTNASDWPRWNSTIVSLEGNIAPNSTIKLVSTLDESRTFTLAVKEFEPERKLVWGDRQGNRVYTITPSDNGVVFSMSEKIGGFLFPLFSRFIPEFDESFEQFAADLKQEVEK